MNKLISALIFSAIATLNVNAFAAGPEAVAKPTAAAKSAVDDKLDINTATEEQLRDFHGIGEARAKAIIKGRPYKAKDDLVKKKVIPKGVYDKIKDNIIAKQAK